MTPRPSGRRRVAPADAKPTMQPAAWFRRFPRRLRRSALLAPFARPDLDLGCERAVDRTLVGDLEEPRTLAIIESAGERDGPIDAVEHPFFGLAALAIGGVDLGVVEPHRDFVERQCLALGVEPQRHRRAGAERREQQVVGTRSAVETARLDRLIGEQAVRTDADLLLEA